MIAALSEVAIQLKGNLAFLLGLGGMFTIVKSLLTGLMILPETESSRPSIAAALRRTRKRIIWLALGSLGLFALALLLYFAGPVATIDPDAMKKSGSLLNESQAWGIGALVVIAILLVVVEATSSVLKSRLMVLSAKD